jgi:hypothetical protein
MLSLPESAWLEAIDADGEVREGAWVAELGEHLDLSEWPPGTRLVCRRERPHPGAQFEIFDANGYRHTAFLTDQEGATSPGSSSTTAAAPGSRTRSAPPRTPGCATRRSAPSKRTKPGSSSRSRPRTCSHGQVALPRGRARSGPAKASAPAPAPCRRTNRPLRAADDAPPATLLALGRGTGCGLPAAALAAATLTALSRAPHGRDDHHAPIAAAQDAFARPGSSRPLDRPQLTAPFHKPNRSHSLTRPPRLANRYPRRDNGGSRLTSAQPSRPAPAACYFAAEHQADALAIALRRVAL